MELLYSTVASSTNKSAVNFPCRTSTTGRDYFQASLSDAIIPHIICRWVGDNGAGSTNKDAYLGGELNRNAKFERWLQGEKSNFPHEQDTQLAHARSILRWFKTSAGRLGQI